MPELAGSGFLLRPYRDDDAESATAALNNRSVWRNLGHAVPYPYTIENAREWIVSCRDTPANELRLTIEIDGKSSGGIGLRPVPVWSPYTFELGYWLGESYWGRGIATAAAALVTKFAFDNFQAERTQAFVFSWNPASRRVLEKNGYTLEGRLHRAVHKDGQWGDLLAYGRLR